MSTSPLSPQAAVARRSAEAEVRRLITTFAPLHQRLIGATRRWLRKLYINRGKGLPDPEKLLRGTAQVRWIHVEGASRLAHPAVACLVDEALVRNRVPFARTGRGPVIIRSASVQRRRRR